LGGVWFSLAILSTRQRHGGMECPLGVALLHLRKSVGRDLLACPEGIEPPTHSLEGCCSIQLSYGQSRRVVATRRSKRNSKKETPNKNAPQTGGLQGEKVGRSTRIRTLDPLVPNQVRYQAAPHSEAVILPEEITAFRIAFYQIVFRALCRR
jgi:hypothetical protein